jgi:hypothetical protein
MKPKSIPSGGNKERKLGESETALQSVPAGLWVRGLNEIAKKNGGQVTIIIHGGIDEEIILTQEEIEESLPPVTK